MIELRDVTFGYDGDQPVLRDVSLTVEEGELVLLSGPTGVGKSTLLGVVTGLVPRFSGGTLHGDVLLDGASILHTPPRERAHAIGYVPQDPAAGFVTDTVEEELAYGMEQLGVDPATMRRRVEETLDLLGITDLRARDLRTLSGGQQQRVALGAVLTMHPRLLVLDEPTSALDPTAAEEVLATLTRLVHDLALSVLLVEHRLERVLPFADRVCLCTGDGRVVVGEPAALVSRSAVVPPLIELGRTAGWDPLPLTVREARRRARGWLDGVSPPSRPAEHEVPAPEPLLQARGLVVRRGSAVAVRDVALTLAPGQVSALMGRNGSGKSSLLWAVQGSLARQAGHLTVDGADPARLRPDQRRLRVGLVPQRAADLLYLETVAEECAAADAGAEVDPGTCRGLLDRLVPGVGDAHHPRDLSEGQRLGLVLAIVLTTRPRVLLLDEPTRGLDYTVKAQLAQVLTDLSAAGHGVLVATHDVEFAARVADAAVVLAEGEVVSAGPARSVLPESPAFAPQVTKVLGAPWLTVADVEAARGAR